MIEPAAGPQPAPAPYHPPHGPLRLVAEGPGWVAVAKPPGLLSVPGRGPDKSDCAQGRVGRLRPGARAVHRLDMATSGLMLFALNADAHSALSAQFAERRVAKRYLALVRGNALPARFAAALPLRGDWERRPRQRVCRSEGKPALTLGHVLCSGAAGGGALVELHPVTGRSHQLRVHLAALGCPVRGDRLYGSEGDPRGPLRLHAAALAFHCPGSAAAVRLLDAPVWAQAGWRPESWSSGAEAAATAGF